MAKELVTPGQCRNRLFVMLAGLFLFIIILHIIVPGDFKERQKLVKKHLDSILPNTLDIEYIEENLLKLDQMDPQLIQYVRIKHLVPPSSLPYNLGNETKNGTILEYKDNFSRWVANFFKNKRNGIFIEAGAHEGLEGSHSLYLEKSLGWTGLLIECNPTIVPYLKSKHRKAWVGDVCLAPTRTPGITNFSNPIGWTYSGTFKKPWKIPRRVKWTFFDVQTIPFYTVLAALGWTEIDYFSFDIEGAELSVLETFPFELVIFKVLIIEIYFYNGKEKKRLKDLLENNDYHFVKKVENDWIFVHNSVKDMLSK